MKLTHNKINKTLALLLGISFIVRALLAGWLEIGNDEVYYWTYALFPDWSHFDHPPMVGWMIQLFSLNLRFDSEFFIRLSSVVINTINTYLVFCIGKYIKDELTGLYAAMLYTASLYAFVITGIFILPDTPQNLFWLLGFMMFVRYFKESNKANLYLVLAGIFTGLSVLSKYTGIFLWVGAGIYILIFNRKSLKNPYLYLSVLLTAICCLPILIWNIQNDFISFSFHGDRVSLFDKVRLDLLGTELLGEFFYNNPINFVLIIIALIAIIHRQNIIDVKPQRLILCTALPLILIFIIFSLSRPTLPHWNAPAYNLLIFLAAAWIREHQKNTTQMPKAIIMALGLATAIVVIGSVEIKTGIVPLDHNTEDDKRGKDDFTLDMYGWEQLEFGFKEIRDTSISRGIATEEMPIIANQWFPLAHIDYYVARPLKMKALGLGPTQNTHKYLWINRERGGFAKGNSYWYITDSRLFKDPKQAYKGLFKDIVEVDKIAVTRNGKIVRYYYVYICYDLKYVPKSLQQ